MGRHATLAHSGMGNRPRSPATDVSIGTGHDCEKHSASDTEGGRAVIWILNFWTIVCMKMDKKLSVSGVFCPWPSTRGSAAGRRWGLHPPQTPVIGSYSALPMVRLLANPRSATEVWYRFHGTDRRVQCAMWPRRALLNGAVYRTLLTSEWSDMTTAATWTPQDASQGRG